MIEKLYALKEMQTNWKLIEKGQVISKINKIHREIMLTQNKINTTSIDRVGAVSDFSILEMHKNTMKLHIKKLEKGKEKLDSQLDAIVRQIVQLQKEMEQYKFILKEQEQEKIKKLLLMQEETSSEYIQNKYIKSQV